MEKILNKEENKSWKCNSISGKVYGKDRREDCVFKRSSSILLLGYRR